jgi:hypothetical protein
VVYVPTALTTTIEALTNYTPVDDPAIRYGIATERLNAPVDRGLGDEVLGYVDKCWIVEWRALPRRTCWRIVAVLGRCSRCASIPPLSCRASSRILHGGRAEHSAQADDPLRGVRLR